MIAQFVLFDGFDALDIVASYEVLGAGGMRTEFVSAEGPREVPSGDPGLSLEQLVAYERRGTVWRAA